MLTKADHDFIDDLRQRGCAVVVFTPDEIAKTGADRWDLEDALLSEAIRLADRWSDEHDWELSSEELEAKHGEEHPTHTRDDYEAEADTEAMGYWHWVWLQLDDRRQ